MTITLAKYYKNLTEQKGKRLAEFETSKQYVATHKRHTSAQVTQKSNYLFHTFSYELSLIILKSLFFVTISSNFASNDEVWDENEKKLDAIR